MHKKEYLFDFNLYRISFTSIIEFLYIDSITPDAGNAIAIILFVTYVKSKLNPSY
jgi:hypothetical protein